MVAVDFAVFGYYYDLGVVLCHQEGAGIMEHADDYYLPGSDSYVGRCPMCNKRTHTCVNELCEDCFDQIELPEVPDEDAERFTERILKLI